MRYKDGREALVEIASLAVLRGQFTARELAAAMTWAMTHRSALCIKWKELNP